MANIVQNHFDLFVTCVDRAGPMLKIWGQTDRVTSMFIEQLLKTTSIQFEKEPLVPQLSSLSVGLLCCAKYKDGNYYRAQITNLRNLVSGSVEVKFIDYGNVEPITIDNIRLLQNVPVGLSTVKPQATDFILANVVHINQHWDDKSIAFIHQEIAYMELPSSIVGAVNNLRFIKLLFHEVDLAEYLIQKGIAVPMPLAAQEMLSRIPPKVTAPMAYQMSPNMMCVPPGYASVQQQPPQMQQQSPQQLSPAIPMQELCSYKTLPLEPNSEHMVYISYVEDGPYLFSIQMQSLEHVLGKLMIEINQLPMLPLTEPPVPGYPCMARCLEDLSICRAVVINLVEDKCKTYYVDFGNTDVLPFSDIFQIPFKYILPKVMSMRFTLAGLKNVNVTNDMKVKFKNYVTNKLLRLKVIKLEGSPVMQYCELYDELGNNIRNILFETMNEYQTNQISKGLKYNIIVSFIEGCKKFFVQLKECRDSLNKLMVTLANTCENSPALTEACVGLPCVAFYSGDNQWYRAQIVSINENSVTVKYVDYGNVDTVLINCVKRIDPNFVRILPAQAIECCLYGYQNMSFNNEIESVFESLTLECEFTMKVINKQSNDTLLVDLFDEAGNNVAALLIEKLAAQKSQISPLATHQITRSILNNEPLNMSPRSEKNYEERSPKSNQEKLSWRNSANDKFSKNSGNDDKFSRNSANEDKFSRNEDRSPRSATNEKKSWKNSDNDKKTWRGSEEPASSDRAQNGSWNGDSPTNKRSGQRNERSFSRSNDRNSNNGHPKDGGKFRSDRFNDKDTGKFRSDRFNDHKKSPINDSGKGSLNCNSGSESEKSWSGNSGGNRSGSQKGFKQSRKPNDFGKKNNFSRGNDNPSAKRKPELPPQDLAPLEEPFKVVEIIPGSSETVSVSWFYNPGSFYCQILSNQKEFRDMMCDIQSAYNGRPSVTTDIPIGASVVAEFQEDTILYRAIVVENKFPKYKVQYVDFGNMSLVDSRKIWQVERKFMDLPIQAVKCGISGIKPANGDWVVSEVVDNIFNKDSFTCSFEGFDGETFTIQLFDNDVSIKQQLIESGIAVDAATSCEMVDEPVDLNILIGQNINVHLSFIQGLNKFYVQLEKNKAILVQESINTLMQSTNIETLQKFTEDQIVSGATCLVQTDDNQWYRGVISNNANMESIEVEYPDIGGSGCYSSDKIYVLPPQLCVYWYQAFECTHHNLSEGVSQLVTDENFKTTYEGQDLIVYVDEILNGRLVVTLYDLSGTKLELVDPDEGAFPTIEPLCAMPVLNSTQSVWVSHVESVNSVYLQRNSDCNTIPALLESLFQHYEVSGESGDFAEGDLCCAKSADGNWYRGRVQQTSDDTVQVLYIDYGNQESLPKESLKVLDQSFYNTHELALNVSLNLQPLSEEAGGKLTELTTEKILVAKIFYAESGWLVELLDGETSVNQVLVDLNLASVVEEELPVEEETPSAAPVAETIPEEPETEIDETRAQVLITHIDSPSEFYVQVVANEESISNLQSDLQERISELPELEGADVGVLCAAKYTVDEQWYRAEVLDADPEITTVRFVDYGNTDVITNNSGSIKTLPADLLAVDKYARKCSLNVVSCKGDEWSQEASTIFENSVNADVIYADIVYQDEKNKTYVELFVNGTNVAEQLLTANLAVPITRDAEDNIANNTGFVSHLNSISEFWIQLESSVPDLEMIVDRLASADDFPDLQDLSPGILCAANFPDDEMWYRARILSNTVAGIEVLFVDYGNSSTAMKLKVLPEDLVQMPILAQKCSLSKPAAVSTWSDQAVEKFREISADGVTIFTIKKLAAGETSIVELFIDGNNIVDQLISFCNAETTQDRMTPIGEPKYTKAHITYAESPNHFWIQLSSDAEKIDEMMNNLASADTFEPLTDFNADTTCAARYPNSGLWYRAKIYELCEQYEVLLVDYGNTMYTDQLRLLPAELEAIPPLATLCTLELPSGVTEWSESAISRFSTAITEGFADCNVEFVNNEVPATVRLFINGKNISEEICSDSPQQALASASATSLISDEVSLLAVNTQLPDATMDGEDEIPDIEEVETEKESLQEEKDASVYQEIGNNSTFMSCGDVTLNNDEFDASGVTDSDNPSDVTVYQDVVMAELTGDQKDVPNEMSLESELEQINQNKTPNISELEQTNKDATPEVTTPKTSRPATPHCEKIVPGSICRGDLETPTEDLDEEIEKLTLKDPVVVKPVRSRPATPRVEKIVAGSISRGDLEEPTPDTEPTMVRSRPVTPHCDKIVPGSICRGDLEKVPRDEKQEVVVTPVRSRPATPLCDKIVPGSICRGDLAEPPAVDDQAKDKEKDSIPETVIKTADVSAAKEEIVCPTTLKASVEEKLLPGSISGEVEPDNNKSS